MSELINHNGGPPLVTEDTNPYGRDGYIRVARRLREHPIVGFGKTVNPADDERGFCYSRAEAWQDLIMECRWSPGEVVNKGRKMEIRPGQLLGAISWLAHRWNWTPKTVRWFLDQLQADHMIQRSEADNDGLLSDFNQRSDGFQEAPKRGNRNGNRISVLSVCNYEIYQIALQAQRQATGQADGKPAASARQANGNTLIREEGKNIINTTAQSQSLDAARDDELPAPEPGKPWTGDTSALTDRLAALCGDAIVDKVNALGLATSATPIMWLRTGCDLEADIVPTMKAMASKYRAKPGQRRIMTWDYFTPAIEEARDKRLAAERRRPKAPPPGMTPDGRLLDDIDRRDADEYEAVRRQWSRGAVQ